MTEKDIEKISQEYKEEKAPLYEKVHNRVEEMYAQQAKKRKKLQTFYKFIPIALAMVVIVSLAVSLPIVLQPDETTPGEETIIWYSDGDIKSIAIKENLKEYASKNNESFLYVDLGEMAEDVKTQKFYSKDDESVTVYLQESFKHGEYGYSISYTVMKSNIVVNSFDEKMREVQEILVNNNTVYYEIGRKKSYAKFEYAAHKYYLEFNVAIDETFLTEIISNMFESQQATA